MKITRRIIRWVVEVLLRKAQNPVMATSCGFDPHQRHQKSLVSSMFTRLFLLLCQTFHNSLLAKPLAVYAAVLRVFFACER